MKQKKVNSFIKWWVTPKLPPEDIFAKHNPITQWMIHPIKRRIARAYLKLLQGLGRIKVIGITGSTGKTTTTEILASILSLSGKTTWSALGIDPVYNIPNTILRSSPDTKYLILEMSVEYVDEMDYYLWLARPDIGIVTNIAASHTEYLKNKEGVAAEKGKLVKKIKKDGVAILNGEDQLVSSMGRKSDAEIVFFGEKSRVSASNVKLNENMSTDFTLKIGKNIKSVQIKALGNQFVNNALAAAAAADALGIGFDKIVKGIENFKRLAHRLNVFMSKDHGMIFDDTYNSNPKAASESLDTFRVVAKGKRKIAVIGDMLELGRLEEDAHRELGKKVGDMGFSNLVGVGNAARFIVEEASTKMKSEKCFLVGNYLEALGIIEPILDKDSALFVKGSRSIHLDKLVDDLK